jgi:uncharacterized Rmd1/YagE family protein
VYNQISLIPDGTAKRDALKLTKKKAKSLPRVTAYATAKYHRHFRGWECTDGTPVRTAWGLSWRWVFNVHLKLLLISAAQFLNARKSAYHTNPKAIDECIYTPYAFRPSNSGERSSVNKHSRIRGPTGDLLGIPELRHEEETGEDQEPVKKRSKFDTTTAEAEIFLFEYGTVVIWGMTEPQERRFLSSM